MTDKVYPKTLIPTEVTVSQVLKQTCPQCTMTHRALKGQNLYTIGGEIDPEVINFDRLCGLSVNVLLCESHPLSTDCSADDVRYGVIGNSKKLAFEKFSPDKEIPDISNIDFDYDEESAVVGFRKFQFEKISGTYPFSKGGKQDGKQHEFIIEIQYDPTLVNVFHFEVTIKGNHENGTFKPLKGRTTKKGYLDAIATMIRNRIIKNNFLFEVS